MQFALCWKSQVQNELFGKYQIFEQSEGILKATRADRLRIFWNSML